MDFFNYPPTFHRTKKQPIVLTILQTNFQTIKHFLFNFSAMNPAIVSCSSLTHPNACKDLLCHYQEECTSNYPLASLCIEIILKITFPTYNYSLPRNLILVILKWDDMILYPLAKGKALSVRSKRKYIQQSKIVSHLWITTFFMWLLSLLKFVYVKHLFEVYRFFRQRLCLMLTHSNDDDDEVWIL